MVAGGVIDSGQSFTRAHRGVGEKDVWVCIQIEARNRFWSGQDVTADRKCPRLRTRFAFSRVVGAGFCAHNANLKRFQAKWIPVRVKKTRQYKDLALRF